VSNCFLRVLEPEPYDGDGEFVPKHVGDAGIDLRAAEDVTVHAGETVSVRLGVAIAVPRGCVGWLSGRSTTALKLGLLVHEGKIDSGYRGEIHCFCTATGSPVRISKGDRICQLIVLKIFEPDWTVVDELSDSSTRGTAGLGSTGLR